MSRRQASLREPSVVAARPQWKTIEARDFAPWHHPPGDELFGIQAIADYLALPFLDVRTLLDLGRLPAWKTLIAHTSRRTALMSHFLAIERDMVDRTLAAPSPADIRPNDAIGLLKGVPAISAHLGCSITGLIQWRRVRAAPIFRLGKHWIARRASLDLWQAQVAEETPSTRRRVSLIAKRAAAAPAGAIVGAVAIAAELGIPEAAAFKGIYRGTIPAFRVGKGWAADRAALADVKRRLSEQD